MNWSDPMDVTCFVLATAFAVWGMGYVFWAVITRGDHL
jgi:glucose dehydrogenase